MASHRRQRCVSAPIEELSADLADQGSGQSKAVPGMQESRTLQNSQHMCRERGDSAPFAICPIVRSHYDHVFVRCQIVPMVRRLASIAELVAAAVYPEHDRKPTVRRRARWNEDVEVQAVFTLLWDWRVEDFLNVLSLHGRGVW